MVWRLSEEITFVLFTKKKKLIFGFFFIISKQILSRAFEAICLVWKKPSLIQPQYFTLFHFVLCLYVLFYCSKGRKSLRSMADF